MNQVASMATTDEEFEEFGVIATHNIEHVSLADGKQLRFLKCRRCVLEWLVLAHINDFFA